MCMRNAGQIASIAAIALVFLVPVTGALADDGRGPRCSDATLRGTYGGQFQGTRPSSPGGPTESVIGVAIRHFDGRGGLTQVDNVKGSISGYVPDRPGSGTYHVNEDCSAVVDFEPAPGVHIQERLVIVDRGHELRSITILPPALMVTSVQLRM